MVEIVFVTVKPFQKVRVAPISIEKRTQMGAPYTDFFLRFSIAPIKTKNWFPYKLAYFSESHKMYSYILFYLCIKTNDK